MGGKVNLLIALSFTHHPLMVSLFEEWNFHQCYRSVLSIIHLRHSISHEFVNEILRYNEYRNALE